MLHCIVLFSSMTVELQIRIEKNIIKRYRDYLIYKMKSISMYILLPKNTEGGFYYVYHEMFG